MAGNTLITALAFAGLVSGITLLHRAWRLKSRDWFRVLIAWALIAGSLWAWSFTSGADKGAALGVVASVIIALAFLAVAALKAPRRAERPTRQRTPSQAPALLLPQRIWSALLIGPLAGIAALAVSTAGFVALKAANVEHTANITIVSFAFPLCWAGLAVAVGYQLKVWRKTLTVAIAALVPLSYLWMAS